jgi:hypothetical protein
MRTNLTVVLIAALACSKAGDSASLDAPKLELAGLGMALYLPKPMQTALDSIAPGFRPISTSSYRSDVPQAALEQAGGASIPALFATVGDFDGDGTTDAAVEGTKAGDSGLSVVAIMNGAAPRAIEVKHFAEFDADAVGVYVAAAPAGAAGFEVVNYPDESTLYTWKDSSFVAQKAP